MKSTREKTTLTALAVLGGAVLLAFALLVRSRAATEPPAPVAAPKPPPPQAARIMSEGSWSHESPEEKFLSVASHAPLKTPVEINRADIAGESKRIFGELRRQFGRMRDLASRLKKSDPARYAAEMELMKEDLARLFQAARILLKEGEVAHQELFRLIREESDPAVKERLGFLLRSARPDLATSFVVLLAEGGPADRKVAITAMSELRTLDAVKGLIQHAAVDADTELRQRSILGLGKTLSQPSPDSKSYQESAWAALRQYADPAQPAALRAAAFEAYSLTPGLPDQDQELLVKTIRTEKDPVVLKPAETAYRHMAARSKGSSDRLNSPSPRPQ